MAAQTKLEAVNKMLAGIDESPVASLTASGIASLSNAIAILDATSRSVQARGWAFNTEYNYPLARNVDNEIPLPANTIFVDPDGQSANIDGVQRGLRLYDRYNHTFKFDVDTVYAKVVLEHDFADLPETAKEYIAMLAKRRFVAEHYQQPEGEATSAEIEALRNFEEAESDGGDHNVLYDNESTARVLRR